MPAWGRDRIPQNKNSKLRWNNGPPEHLSSYIKNQMVKVLSALVVSAVMAAALFVLADLLHALKLEPSAASQAGK